MRDRTPTRALENGALRYGVYDEAGNLLRYEYLALEDEPTDPGTALSKATLLQDSTEMALFGSAADRTVDDAFVGLATQLKLIMSDSAAITLALTDSAGHGLPGVLVQGVLSESGQAVVSNAAGVVSGYVAEGSQTLKISGYADIKDYSETITVTKGTSITKTLTLTVFDFLDIKSSKSIKFSGNVSKIDFCLLGAGGGGGGGFGITTQYSSGAGGGGGDVYQEENFVPENEKLYPVIIGAGGDGGANYNSGSYAAVDHAGNGSDGGSTSAFGKTAEGGKGGQGGRYNGATPAGGASNNGAGANGVSVGYHVTAAGLAGNPGTKEIFASFTATMTTGGGGGSGKTGSSVFLEGGPGGSPAGGKGGSRTTYTSQNDPVAGLANRGGGGGGGAADTHYDDDGLDQFATDGAAGGSGRVTVRMHLKSAA